jgi:hypothetical protein
MMRSEMRPKISQDSVCRTDSGPELAHSVDALMARTCFTNEVRIERHEPPPLEKSL